MNSSNTGKPLAYVSIAPTIFEEAQYWIERFTKIGPHRDVLIRIPARASHAYGENFLHGRMPPAATAEGIWASNRNDRFAQDRESPVLIRSAAHHSLVRPR